MLTIELDGKNYDLSEEHCLALLDDEEKPLKSLKLNQLLEWMAASDRLYFEKVYYDVACDQCGGNRSKTSKYYQYLEAHFYLFAKDGQVVKTSLDQDYKEQSLLKLMKEKLVDDSYLVSVNICPACGTFSVDLEYDTF